MLSIFHLVKATTRWYWHQDNIRWIVEVYSVEGKGAYWRWCFEGGSDVTPPPLDTVGIKVIPMSDVDYMRGQVVRKGSVRIK